MLVSEDVIYVDRLLLPAMKDECKATAALDQKQQQNYWIKKADMYARRSRETLKLIYLHYPPCDVI